MADFKFNSRDQKELYRLILLLNGSLQFIVLRLQELSANKIFKPKYLKEILGITQKVQTEIDAVLEPKE